MRRAELIQGLQERVQEYERQGVAATQEMQRAARKVAQDNVRLRDLLALHGVSSEQVESFLRASDEPGPSGATHFSLQSPSTTPRCEGVEKVGDSFSPPAESLRHSDRQYLGHEHPTLDSRPVPDTAENDSAQVPDSSQLSASIVQPGTPSPETLAECDDAQSHREGHAGNFLRPAPESSECPSSLECFCAPPPASEYRPSSSGLKISCEAAATVIAEMRGYGDRDSIRASLGCRGQETCTVKNSMVMQIMDEG
jgi:hypothetical protein